MSKRRGERGKCGQNGSVPYEVGFGRPPVEHQYPKGTTGNKYGRPPKSRLTIKDHAVFPTGYGLEIANRILIDEAYRLVSVREGDQVFQIPLIQAVMRAVGLAALKGDRHAQRIILERVGRIEAEDRELRRQCLEATAKYKAEWGRAIARARAAGRPEPQPIPHPNDIIIDSKTGDIFLCGPDSEQDKARWDKQLQRRSDAQEEVSYCASERRKARGPLRKAMWLKAQQPEQKIFDIINDNLPRRYRVELKDRSYAEGASRAGSERRVYWPEP